MVKNKLRSQIYFLSATPTDHLKSKNTRTQDRNGQQQNFYEPLAVGNEWNGGIMT